MRISADCQQTEVDRKASSHAGDYRNLLTTVASLQPLIPALTTQTGRRDGLPPERHAAGGAVTRHNKLVEASGILGYFDTEEQARRAGLDWTGLDWARAWVDSHG